MIKLKDLSYRYGKNGFELDKINIEVEPGYITVLVGNNGCGKTTLMRNMYGSLIPKSGEIFLDDKKIEFNDLAEYHRSVAIIGKSLFADYYTIGDNAELFRNLYDNFDEDMFLNLINKFDLGNRIDSKYDILSRGQKVKVDIAFALAIKPKYLILDEPFAGLDEVSKQDIVEILQNRINEDNMGVFVSTHLLDEIEDIADYVIMMKDGKIIKSGDRDSVIKPGSTLTEEAIEVIGNEGN